MKTTINNNPVFISFPDIHVNQNKEKQSYRLEYLISSGFPALAYTEGLKGTVYCIIKNESGDTIASGVAHCSPRDSYTKTIGEKKALARALQSMGSMGKHARKVVWDDYFVSSTKRRKFHAAYLAKKEELVTLNQVG